MANHFEPIGAYLLLKQPLANSARQEKREALKKALACDEKTWKTIKPASTQQFAYESLRL
jgi:hypothetical protein